MRWRCDYGDLDELKNNPPRIDHGSGLLMASSTLIRLLLDRTVLVIIELMFF